MTDDKLTALAARLRDHASDYITHPDDACKHSDLIAAAEYLRQCAKDEPTIDINIKIAVPANWSNRLDMQWIVEREIHADRWSWSYAAPQAMNTQADAIEALREVARIAHDGVGNLGFGEALVAIRKLTLPFWTRRAVLAAQGGKNV